MRLALLAVIFQDKPDTRRHELATERIDTGLGQSLTEIERKILDFMVHYLRSNTYQPSIREIGERFGIKSTKTVSEHLQALADKGFLERDPSRSRGVKILGMDLAAQTISIPCYRELPAEYGGKGQDLPELHLSLDRRLVGSKSTFVVRARGNEFGALNVDEGDLLLIEPARPSDLEEDSIVLAQLGASPAFFRYSRNGRGVRLTELSSGTASLVEDPDAVRIVGRLAGLYRQMVGVPALVSTAAH